MNRTALCTKIAYGCLAFLLLMLILSAVVRSLSARFESKLPLRRLRMSSFEKVNSIQRICDHLVQHSDIRTTLADTASGQQLIDECLRNLAQIRIQDLGISDEDIAALTDMQCMNIVETENFHVAVFLLPKGCSIPMHDHPSMTVCSKVIRGSLRVKSFTALNKASSSGATTDSIYRDTEPMKIRKIPCRLENDKVKTDQDPGWALGPIIGNYHEFTARDPTVIVDVLMPPYDEPDRPCNFYKIVRVNKSVAQSSKKGSKGSKTNRSPNTVSWALDYIPEDIAEETIELPYVIEYTGYIPTITAAPSIGGGGSVTSSCKSGLDTEDETTGGEEDTSR